MMEGRKENAACLIWDRPVEGGEAENTLREELLSEVNRLRGLRLPLRGRLRPSDPHRNAGSPGRAAGKAAVKRGIPPFFRKAGILWRKRFTAVRLCGTLTGRFSLEAIL